MFNLDNTEGFSPADCDLMNLAVAALMERGWDEKNACDHVNDNWQGENDTVATLIA